MRPLGVLLLAAAVFGTLAAYARFVSTMPEPDRKYYALPAAQGKFSLELTLSFDAQKDEFSFDEDPAVLVRSADRDLLRREGFVSGLEPLVVDDVEGIVKGKNAFFVRAVPAAEFATRPSAVQIRVLRDGNPLAENTLWSSPGSVVAGEIVVEVPDLGGKQDDHVH